MSTEMFRYWYSILKSNKSNLCYNFYLYHTISWIVYIVYMSFFCQFEYSLLNFEQEHTVSQKMEADLLWLLSLSLPLDWKLFPLSSTCPESFSTRPCTWLGSFAIKGPTSQIASGSGLQQNKRNECIEINGPPNQNRSQV